MLYSVLAVLAPTQFVPCWSMIVITPLEELARICVCLNSGCCTAFEFDSMFREGAMKRTCRTLRLDQIKCYAPNQQVLFSSIAAPLNPTHQTLNGPKPYTVPRDSQLESLLLYHPWYMHAIPRDLNPKGPCPVYTVALKYLSRGSLLIGPKH